MELAVGALVVDIVKIAASLPAQWQQSSDEIYTFVLRAKALERKWKQTKEILKRQGLNLSSIDLGLEEDALKVLTDVQEAEKKLRNSWELSRKLRHMTSPSGLTRLINAAYLVVDGIEESIDYGNRLRATLSTFQTQIEPLGFGEDEKYVPLANGVAELKKALECQEGGVNQVVTLHGPFGSGKTALGKYLALLCRGDVHVQASISTTSRELQNTGAHLTNLQVPSAREPSDSPVPFKGGFTKWWSRIRPHKVRETVSIEPSDTGDLDSEGPLHIPFAEKVVFLRCGHNANSGVLLQELCIHLGYRDILQKVTDGATSPNLSGIQVSSIRSELSARLLSEQILIVLDDIWEDTVVQELLFQKAKGVKYLLISHMEWIWRDADRIFLQKAATSEAHQILANHLKRRLPEIPDNIKNEIIVEHAKQSPWKISRIACLINEQCKDGRPEKILKILKDHEEIVGGSPMPIYGRLYSKGTLRNACSLVLDCFRNEECTLKLACLVAIFGNPEVSLE